MIVGNHDGINSTAYVHCSHKLKEAASVFLQLWLVGPICLCDKDKTFLYLTNFYVD